MGRTDPVRPGAIFLDRDGVINYNREDYVKTPEEFQFLPGSAAAVARLTRAGRAVFVVSNQAGLARGVISAAALEAITQKMLGGLTAAGARVNAVYYCTHHPDAACECRKPSPGMLLRAAKEHGLQLQDAVFVGDDLRDVAAGRAAGTRTVLVLSGKCGRADADRLLASGAGGPTHVTDDLSAAVDWILDQSP